MTINNRNLFIGAIVAAVVIGLLAFTISDRDEEPTPTPAPTTTSTPPVVTPTPTPTPTPTSTISTPPVATSTPPTSTTSTQSIQQQVRSRSDALLTAFKNKDINKIVSYVHPTKGVRFSMQTYVDTAKDKKYTRAQLLQYYNTNVKFTWGNQEGSGEAVVIPMKEYFDKFVYDQDYLKAPQIHFNTFKGATSSINNAPQVYPNAQIIQYYFPGFDAQYEGLDWEAVRLVWEKSGNEWYVVGIIHDAWGG